MQLLAKLQQTQFSIRANSMPINAKGKKILSKMIDAYGKDRAKHVFYASINAGKIKDVEGKKYSK